ncbi:hypothetical protein D9M69_729650 [compost metagenome]
MLVPLRFSEFPAGRTRRTILCAQPRRSILMISEGRAAIDEVVSNTTSNSSLM